MPAFIFRSSEFSILRVGLIILIFYFLGYDHASVMDSVSESIWKPKTTWNTCPIDFNENPCHSSHCVDVIQHGVAICVTMGKKVTSHYLDEADVWSCSKLKTHWGKCYTWGSATRGIYTANFPHEIYMWKICSFAAVYFQKSHPCCRKKCA